MNPFWEGVLHVLVPWYGYKSSRRKLLSQPVSPKKAAACDAVKIAGDWAAVMADVETALQKYAYNDYQLKKFLDDDY